MEHQPLSFELQLFYVESLLVPLTPIQAKCKAVLFASTLCFECTFSDLRSSLCRLSYFR